MVGDIKVLKPEWHLMDKEMIMNSGQDMDKHLMDIEQIKKYLNENFFIISTKRKNLLEHGLSWCLRNIHKRLNVYSFDLLD